MDDFVDAALSFPAVLFGFLLVVVVLYWLLVVLGTLDIDLVGGDGDIGDGDGDGGGDGGFLDGLGLGGVPITVTLSVLIVFAWFVSIVGGVLLSGMDGVVGVLLGIGVLLVALFVGLFVARLVAVPLRRLYVSGPEPSRSDFVGRECVIRTGRVSTDFGQAEVTAVDGSSAVIQVRQTGEHELTAGQLALIFDYDTNGEFFWVAPAT
ncbi:hypothetical protein [Actinophytocola sp.]|uniref:hypothetical protein n=1 Tax=Actinophytocola sp. TaxID=1872138 RepID=UPI003D6BEDC1